MGTFIICEAGINHNGDIQEAMRLIVAAKRCGADAVKFQHFSSRRLWADDRIHRYELTIKQQQMLKEQADSLGIEYMCTAFDTKSYLELWPMLKRAKVSSGCINDADLLEAIYGSGLPVLLSTGMASMAEIEKAMSYFDRDRVTLLQCTSTYPCPVEDVNLNVMEEYRWAFDMVDVGLSDHTTTISVPIAAVALEATVIEKHLTLDRNAPGPDHQSSIEPEQFKAMVEGIREVEKAMGSTTKQVQPSEAKLREAWHARR